MPRFLGFAELVLLRHVAYAVGVLLRICSLCEGRNMPRFLAFAKLSTLRHVAYANGILLRTCSLCRERDVMSLCLWHFGWVYFFIVSTSMEGLYMIQ